MKVIFRNTIIFSLVGIIGSFIYLMIPTINEAFQNEGKGSYLREVATASQENTTFEDVDHLPILMYHHFSEKPEEWGETTVSPQKFKSDLLTLKSAGYTTVHPEDVIAHKEGIKSLPAKPVLITMDDGYESNYIYAYPILKDLNMKASIHIIGKDVGKMPGVIKHFNWEEAKEMSDSGVMSIQSHTYELHDKIDEERGLGKGVMKHDGESDDLHKARVKIDLTNSINDIETYIEESVVALAYPFGAREPYLDDLLKTLNFKMSYTVDTGVANINSDLFSMPRINVPSSLDSHEIIKLIEQEIDSMNNDKQENTL